MNLIGIARRRPLLLPALAVGLALFVAACSGGSETTPTTEARSLESVAAATDDAAPAGSGADQPRSSDEPEAATFNFPTGEPVLVSADYTHPNDHVDNTGAYLPTNGKPTLVFVDAIW